MTCLDDRRRAKLRTSAFNGIDSVDVCDSGLALTVVFFGKAPENLVPQNFRIDGGRRITGIEVVGVRACADEDAELADRVKLTVDRAGDLSTYRLAIVEPDPRGGPSTTPYPGFDPRYDHIDFTFFPQCGDLDCSSTSNSPQQTPAQPEIDYLAKDYASFRQLLLDRLSLTMPQWTERHVPDIGITLVELLAYEGDRLSYRQDAVATEAYLDTARLRTSVRRHARLVDYRMHDGCAARAWVSLDTEQDLLLTADDFRFATIEADAIPGRGAALLAADLDQPYLPPHEIFEPAISEPVQLYAKHSTIHIWTWGDAECCLPTGTTSATFVDSDPGDSKDRILHLAPGDVVLFEEVLGAKTGLPADADHSHRQAVRLLTVAKGVDKLYDQPVLEVTWAPEDALTFPLCVSARGGPQCTDLEVGVARGNTVLVEHGRSVAWCKGETVPQLPVPTLPSGEPGCPPPVSFGCPDPAGVDSGPPYPPLPVRFQPSLPLAPVTRSAPFPSPAGIAAAQAKRLRGLPERARRRLTAIWRYLGQHDELPQGAHDYLTTLFGADTLRKVGLDHHPRNAVRTLLARFDELLAVKLDRLRELVRRARAGYVLTDKAEGWEIGQSWGKDEQDRLRENDPVFRGPATVATTPDPREALPDVLVTDQYGEDWVPQHDLLDSGPDDRHFVGETDDNGVLSLRFGDGLNGAEFPLADQDGQQLSVRFRVGNGLAGNVGREAISRIISCSTLFTPIRVVRNPLPATGGTDPEPVDVARRRAPHETAHQLLRAITPADYATLAGQIPGVQRAAADFRWTGSWYEAQVAVDPLGAEVAPDRLLDEVRESLFRYRRIGHDLAVYSATLVPLEVGLRIGVAPDHVAGHVKAGVLAALGALFTPDALTFGQSIRVSRLVAAATSVPGVVHAEVTVLRREFGGPSDALRTDVLPIGPLEVAQLDNDPSRPENGLLTLEMEGGR